MSEIERYRSSEDPKFKAACEHLDGHVRAAVNQIMDLGCIQEITPATANMALIAVLTVVLGEALCQMIGSTAEGTDMMLQHNLENTIVNLRKATAHAYTEAVSEASGIPEPADPRRH